MSEYKQTSFSGGINLLLDDTRLPVSFKYKEGDTPYDITFNQYRLGLNVRTRFDVCSPVLSSYTDLYAPAGVKQALVAFGNYLILFVAGSAYYRLSTQTNWIQVLGFGMSKTAPRYWTVAVPLTTTNYGRLAGQQVTGSTTDSNTGITTTNYGSVSANLPVLQVSTVNKVAGSFANLPGLLVQDGVNQPQFLYIDQNNTVQCRTTQTYAQWSFTLDPVALQLTGPDKREYVPIGTYMEWFNGILFIVDPKFTYIYRSVSGRPLDFVVNVNQDGSAGGDATTTSYSVGVAGITAIRAMPGNTLFVAAGGASCFAITLNTTPNAPQIFGEYTFIRTVLFNANCITERGIIDVLGDSVFIDANGLRSFNAVEQQQNEGRNSVFSSTVQGLFNGIFQSAQTFPPIVGGWCSAINFDNYAIFSVNTTLGYALVVYDTINTCYSSVDVAQLGGHAAKQFAAITIDTLALYAITDDDRVVQLYAQGNDVGIIRLGAVSSQDPKKELKVSNIRVTMTNITKECDVTCALFTNNRLDYSFTQKIGYRPAANTYSGQPLGADIGTQTNNLCFPFPNASQGWKAFAVLSWTGGASLACASITTQDSLPMQPLQTQAVIEQI